jgi:hypothetical protein
LSFSSDDDLSDGEIWKFVYDEKGNLIEKVKCSLDGSFGYKHKLTYNNNGKLIEERICAADDDYEFAEERWKLVYDNNGNLLEKRYHCHDGTNERTRYAYDNK